MNSCKISCLEFFYVQGACSSACVFLLLQYVNASSFNMCLALWFCFDKLGLNVCVCHLQSGGAAPQQGHQRRAAPQQGHQRRASGGISLLASLAACWQRYSASHSSLAATELGCCCLGNGGRFFPDPPMGWVGERSNSSEVSFFF